MPAVLGEGRRELLAMPSWCAWPRRPKPFRALIDPDDPGVSESAGHAAAVRDFCRRRAGGAGDRRRDDPLRAESLALKYRRCWSGRKSWRATRFAGLHIVGGGIHNKLLCQSTADAIGRPVWAGPAEASAIGNIAVQYDRIGTYQGSCGSPGNRARSFPVRTFEPEQVERWDRSVRRVPRASGIQREARVMTG